MFEAGLLQLDLLAWRHELGDDVRLVLPGQVPVHVKLQLVLAGEALATSLTGEGPLPGVSPDVSVEVRHSSKLCLTICASVRPDAVMNLKKNNLEIRLKLK